MPDPKRTMDLPGFGRVEVSAVHVNQAQETFNSYLLDDGTSLRMKSVVTEVLRLLDRYDDEGNPVYMVKSQNLVVVDAPASLKKKAK